MKSIMSANKHTYYSLIVAIVVSVIILLEISGGIHLRATGDDFNFSRILNNSTTYDVVLNKYLKWSGRVSIDAFMVYTMRYEYVWKIIIPASILLLSLSVSELCLKDIKNRSWAFLIALVLFFCIDKGVNNDASWWVAGAYNYLMPASLCIFTVLLYINRMNNIYLLIGLALPASLYFGFHEQISICFLLFAMCHSLNNKCISITRLSVVIVTTICAVILFMSPGNSLRFFSEAKNWFPEYMDYNIFQKFIIGLDILSAHISSGSNVLLNVSIACILALTIRNNRHGFLVSIAMVFLIIKLFMFLTSGMKVEIFGVLYNSPYLGGANFANPNIYISYVISIATIVCIIYLGLINFGFSQEGKSITFTIILACASVMMIMFSPSAYGSGKRILFVFQIMMMLHSSMLINEIIKKEKAA